MNTLIRAYQQQKFFSLICKFRYCIPVLRQLSLPVLLLCLGSFRPIPEEDKFSFLLHETGKTIRSSHYQPIPIDDQFSEKVFYQFLKKLDPDHTIFLQKDISSLQTYLHQLDDEILGKPVDFFYAVNVLYLRRLSAIYQHIPRLGKKPFDFSEPDSIKHFSGAAAYPHSEKEQLAEWRKKIKYTTLEKYIDIEDDLGKLRNDSAGTKTTSTPEEDARKFAVTVFQKTLERLLHRVTEEDRFSQFVNTVTHLVDPHSDFFLPVEKRSWDEDMTGKFYGIGAIIDSENGQILIGPVASGGAAWKSGDIQEGDIILKVGQGEQDPVDIAGYDVPDVVQLIRGDKGTIVKLTIKKPGGLIKTVPLERAELKLEETFSRSAIIREQGKKIGYIYLPKFYSSMGAAGGRNCHEDIAQEVVLLRNQGVEGIIIDLRNNGGGSLYEAIKMAGLFIPAGPMVQVRSGNGRSDFYEDNDGGRILYDGPLEVLVNEFSASASEIFAAAIQDYQRGVISGSSTTYGKGTVQRPISLPPSNGQEPGSAASIHLTVQKYYRINGASTQLKGVVPDIILPGYYEYYPVKEKDNPASLNWDEISRLPYSSWHKAPNIRRIREVFHQRTDSTGIFDRILACSQAIFQNRASPRYLSLALYRSAQQHMEEQFRTIRELTRLREEMDISESKNAGDSDLLSRRWISILKKDMYLRQATLIMETMIRDSNSYGG